MAELFLAIDAGGTAVKAAVFDPAGQLVALQQIEIETHHRPNGWVERDPRAFWERTARSIRQLTATLVDADRIAAVACTGFGNGLFLVDAHGAPTRDGIVSIDHRAQALVECFAAEGVTPEIEAINGQRCWGGQTLMQLAWLQRHEAEVLQRSRWLLCCKDYVRLCLTGIAATDPTDASGGGLLDLGTGDWSERLLSLAGLAEMRHLLPDLAENSAVAGRVTAEAAAATGLRAGTPVATSMMDVGACVLGSGVTNSDVLTMIAGTWSINAIEATRPVQNGVPPLLDMIHRDRACRLLADGSPASAGNLHWYLAKIGAGSINLETANQLAASSPAAGPRCHFMPFVHGPTPRRGAFLGLTNADDNATMMRALFEGVAFQHRRHAEDIQLKAGGEAPSVIHLAGGASKSRAWTQIFADVTGLPVAVSEGEELGALGAALTAAVATGHHANLPTAARAMCRIARMAYPEPHLRDFYESRYRDFLRLDRETMTLFG